MSSEPVPVKLTSRQQEVLVLVAAGLTAIEIGQRLEISPRTVRAHIEVLKQKLGARRSRELPSAYKLRTGVDPFTLSEPASDGRERQPARSRAVA